MCVNCPGIPMPGTGSPAARTVTARSCRTPALVSQTPALPCGSRVARRLYSVEMPRFTAEQIYAVARQAGFSPDQSATMTAIAMAESGGDSRSHATVGEDSRGLWQINAQAHPDP